IRSHFAASSIFSSVVDDYPVPANSEYPVPHSFHRYGHRYGPLVKMVSIRGSHVPCRWGRKRESPRSPREGAFAHDERSSSGAKGSRLSLFWGSFRNVPVLGLGGG